MRDRGSERWMGQEGLLTLLLLCGQLVACPAQRLPTGQSVEQSPKKRSGDKPEDGKVVQSNFHNYDAIRMNQAPDIEVRVLENGEKIRGIGEPGTPPAAPALANAIFAATGQRIRELPLRKHIKFA